MKAVRRHNTSATLWRTTYRVWFVLGGVRVALWIVLALFASAGRLSLSAYPLIIFLYPEVLLIPYGYALTPWTVAFFAIVLAVGSLIAAFVVASLWMAARRWFGEEGSSTPR